MKRLARLVLPLSALYLASCGGDPVVGPDRSPPGRVTDLAVQASTPTSLTIRWTAPGDDGSAGTAASYEIRRSEEPITSSNFATATPVPPPVPAMAGTVQTAVVGGLEPGIGYYIALRAADEIPNLSPISNVLFETTDTMEVANRVFHATPDGTGPDCGNVQDCLDRAAPGDTVEFAAGIYSSVADTLLEGGEGPIVANIVARNGVVLRAAPGAEARIDGEWQAGRVGIVVPDDVAELKVSGLRFDNCDPGIYTTGGRLEVVDCAFVSGNHGLVAAGALLDVRNCRFEEYANEAMVLRNCTGAVRSTAFRGNGSALFAAASRGLVVEDVLVAFACFAGIRVEEGGSVTARGITIMGAGMVPDDSTAIVVAGGAELTLERAVVSENRGFGIDCRTGGTATVRCSDFFNNSAGNYAGCADATGTEGNLAVDPLFCSKPDLDFHLQAGSPAATAPCGAMGAFGDEPCSLRRNSLGWTPAFSARAREHYGPDHHQGD